MVIGLLGFGTVGGGVYELLNHRKDITKDITVKYVLDRYIHDEISAVSTTDFNDIINDDEVDTVVELMGGIHPAYEYVTAALEKGKNVITANKHLISKYYDELTKKAMVSNVALRYTAAVGGGIPWLVNLRRARRLSTIYEITGIFNGTTNFILDAMHTKGADFSVVLKEAQELGFAEANPSSDIDGLDVQRKIIISANIAFGAVFKKQDVNVFGVRNVSAEDIKTFEDKNLICKLIASAYNKNGKYSVFAEPTLVCNNSLEASVHESYNLITFDGEYVGRESFYGHGAGRYPTAYTVAQDCIDVSAAENDFALNSFTDCTPDNSAISHCYYVRTSKPTEWLNSVTEEVWGKGVKTKPVPVSQMFEEMSKILKNDQTAFMAAVKEEQN